MKKSDFFYELPEELIAQTPLEKRDDSRLLILSKESGEVSHSYFYNILDFLKPNDLLVMNNSRVIPARIFGTRTDTGATVEFLLLKQIENNKWETLVKPGKKAKIGTEFNFSDIMKGTVEDIGKEGVRIVRFESDENIYTALDKIGQMPLPPYIKEHLKDNERYQTVYSEPLGSAAAPTAGLHFTNELLKKIREKGINTAFVTLHVGLGTFRPVKEDEITDHIMHSEHYTLPQETVDLINETKAKGGRVIAVGTTTTRTLESVAKNYGKLVACDGWTEIFIYPPYEFKVLDGLITNFHLPESTLVMLVSAFAGYENTMNAYNEAVKEQYRFFSFGDSMIII
ncbi:MAG: tRNA preQ1(34) S-adenosylmethionine ribosyltransferase-isomerase QueA [Ruminococcaceae bacterium]|nr:tRNA preQ1(34) S-adenosylmethionine ribosyltransferase-isomerase QueA [Oscillospiraceae bacterium]